MAISFVEEEMQLFWLGIWSHVTTLSTLAAKFVGNKPRQSEDKTRDIMWPCDHWWVEAPHPKSLLCQVWCLQVLWKWRYSVFILSCDITWPHDQRNMWLYEWESLTLTHDTTKFGGSRLTRKYCSRSLLIAFTKKFADQFLSPRKTSKNSTKDRMTNFNIFVAVNASETINFFNKWMNK